MPPALRGRVWVRCVRVRYDDGKAGVQQGTMAPGADSTTNSYPGHTFCFAELDAARGCEEALHKVVVNENDYTYLFEDGTANQEHQGLWDAEVSRRSVLLLPSPRVLSHAARIALCPADAE